MRLEVAATLVALPKLESMAVQMEWEAKRLQVYAVLGPPDGALQPEVPHADRHNRRRATPFLGHRWACSEGPRQRSQAR